MKHSASLKSWKRFLNLSSFSHSNSFMTAGLEHFQRHLSRYRFIFPDLPWLFEIFPGWPFVWGFILPYFFLTGFALSSLQFISRRAKTNMEKSLSFDKTWKYKARWQHFLTHLQNNFIFPRLFLGFDSFSWRLFLGLVWFNPL